MIGLRLFAAVLTIAVSVAASAGESFQGKVVAVADGDTVTVLRDKQQVRIRLHGVDAPEKAQPYGEQAKQLTSRLVFGRQVRVEVVTTDKYGRTVARIYVTRIESADHMDDGSHRPVDITRCLNEELVTAGLAWWYRSYAPRDPKLAKLEGEAKRAKRGLWADAAPTAPWDWRHQRGIGRPATQPAPPSTHTAGLYRGNPRSKALHAPGCADYRCKACTAGYGSVEEAKRAGYRPHQTCLTAFERCQRECARRNAARAVGAGQIEADCRRECSQ